MYLSTHLPSLELKYFSRIGHMSTTRACDMTLDTSKCLAILFNLLASDYLYFCPHNQFFYLGAVCADNIDFGMFYGCLFVGFFCIPNLCLAI